MCTRNTHYHTYIGAYLRSNQFSTSSIIVACSKDTCQLLLLFALEGSSTENFLLKNFSFTLPKSSFLGNGISFKLASLWAYMSFVSLKKRRFVMLFCNRRYSTVSFIFVIFKFCNTPSPKPKKLGKLISCKLFLILT